LNNM